MTNSVVEKVSGSGGDGSERGDGGGLSVVGQVSLELLQQVASFFFFFVSGVEGKNKTKRARRKKDEGW